MHPVVMCEFALCTIPSQEEFYPFKIFFITNYMWHEMTYRVKKNDSSLSWFEYF